MNKSKDKKKYRRPEIVSREKLEAVAGACVGGKTQTGIPACAAGPVNS